MATFATFTDLGGKLTDETRRAFKAGFKFVREGGRALFNVTETDKRIEVFNSAVNDKHASRTGEGENFAIGSPTNGDELTMTQYKVTFSSEVTTEQEEYDQYGMEPMLSGANSIGTALANKMEMDIQQFVKNGASASYTDADGNTIATTAADGLSLFNNSHTVNGSSSTYDNLDSTAFGQTGLEAMEDLFRKFLNHDGQRANRKPSVIFSTTKPSLTNLISEYADSKGHPEDQFHGLNTYINKYDHVALEYLDTDTSGGDDSSTDDYWGLAVRKGDNLKVRVSKNPVIHPPMMSLRNRNKVVQGEAWFAVGVEDPIDIALSQA